MFLSGRKTEHTDKVVALDELIIFAIHGNFPRRLFRAVEAFEVGRNMQNMTFFIFQLDTGYGVRKMTAWGWRVVPLAGHGASGTNFFDRQGLMPAILRPQKMRSHL